MPPPCVEALEEALATYGTPEFFNSNQGCQYTNHDWSAFLKAYGPDGSMSRRGN
jgi:putative transposase